MGRDKTPTFLSGSDSKASLMMLNDMMGMVVGRRIEGAVNLPSVPRVVATSSRGAPKKSTSTLTTPTMMQKNPSNNTDTLNVDADDLSIVSAGSIDPGQISPSSSV